MDFRCYGKIYEAFGFAECANELLPDDILFSFFFVVFWFAPNCIGANGISLLIDIGVE